MTKPPVLFIGDTADSSLLKHLKRLHEESQPVKDIGELAILNKVRRINGMEPYTAESWNAKHFPSSLLH